TWVPGDFINGTRNWGELRTPEVDTTKGESLFLTFWHVIHGEADPKFDNGHLWLYDGTWHKITPFSEGYDTTDSSWWKETVNISAYAGKQIKLEFRFDTQDAINNVFMGWFVDDVTIYGSMVKRALAINNIDLSPYVNLEPITINAMISNIGRYNETAILINLTDDGLVVNQTMIPWLDSGTMSVFRMGWEPKYLGVHDICFEATAASGTHTRACVSTIAGFTPPKNLWIYKSGTTFMLEWEEPPFPSVQGYNIYRATSVNGFDFNTTYATMPVGTNMWIDPQSDAGIDANNYFYVVRAFDERDIEEQNLNKVGKFVKQLYKGTNEISIGFELKDNSTSIAFESVTGLYKSVEAFDAQTCVWYVWTPTGGSLTEIDRSMGLRVTMKSDGSLINVGRVKDTSIVLPEVTACANWNFVGYPSFVTGALPGVLDDGGMAGKYDLVLWYDPLDKKQHWKWFDSNDPGGSPLKALEPGMGIWIHVVQAGVWHLYGD
ncbi:MAG: hypothetical protein KAW09_03180, partial [Thermoplasmata archaeon]|nr:hypothetical protein [Thermoplasmata archaeon]